MSSPIVAAGLHTAPIWDLSGAQWYAHPANPRFSIYGQGAGPENVVFDRETGLVWERSPETAKYAWDPAIVRSYSKAVAGRKGWRLPAIEELLSLVDPSHSPTLPQGHPFLNVQVDYFYWSSTLGMTSPPTNAWGYTFGNGDTSNVLKTAPCYLWLVRGGYGHDYSH